MGGDEMYCGPYSAGVLHSVSDQVQNLQNCFTTPNKMTSEDDIKGLVSLSSFVHDTTPPVHNITDWVGGGGERGRGGGGVTASQQSYSAYQCVHISYQ